MKLVLFLLLMRYLLRLIPASILGGLLLIEDLEGQPKPGRPEVKQNGQEKNSVFS